MTDVWIVDDDALNRDFLLETITRTGRSARAFASAEEALPALGEDRIRLLITDFRLPGMDGLELLRRVRAAQPCADAIVITAFGSVERAVACVKEGAYDFLVKPFGRERLETLLERVWERQSLVEETRTLRTALESRFRFDRIVGKSGPMRALYELIERVAGSDATALIRGESGTGKELIARSIHWNSRRRSKPFVKVSCGSIPEGLLESELFGHEKGAFTSAVCRRIGRFEEAGDGTVFLDEVGDLSPALQVKLLNVLQDRVFERLGSNRPIETGARVIAATHRDLERRMAEGVFREDLYYRLNVVQIPVPPLRERREDVPLLAEHFLEANRVKYPRREFAFTAGALHVLCRYDWPGNVREMENAIERACVVAPGGRIRPEDLPPTLGQAGSAWRGAADTRTLREVEREHVLAVLAECGGNRSRAARMLGIDRSSLLRKVREYEGEAADVPREVEAEVRPQ